jgi:hypothetical protein
MNVPNDKIDAVGKTSCFTKFNRTAISARRVEQRTSVIDKDSFWDGSAERSWRRGILICPIEKMVL